MVFETFLGFGFFHGFSSLIFFFVVFAFVPEVF